MRINLHSSQWPSEAAWAKSALSWALEIVSEKTSSLKSYAIYPAQAWHDGQTGSVALEAHIEASDFEAAGDLVLDLIDEGLDMVNARESRGIVYKYSGGAVEEEGLQEEFLRVLKTEFNIDPVEKKPLTPAQIAFEAAAVKRGETLKEALEAMYGGKIEEPSL